MQSGADAGSVEKAREPDSGGDAQAGRMAVQRQLERPLADQGQLQMPWQAGECVQQPEQTLTVAQAADIEDVARAPAACAKPKKRVSTPFGITVGRRPRVR